MIDTHAHLYGKKFEGDLDETIERAKSAGITKILLPNIDESSVDEMLEVVEKNPGFCYAMMGIHPCSVNKEWEKQVEFVADWLKKDDRFIAVGEIGTDLYWDKSLFEEQKQALIGQIALAAEYDLPIVLHCRDSIDETIEIVAEQKNKYPSLKGIFHCFTGDQDQYNKIIDLDFLVGLGGVATFKNGGMDKVIPDMDPSKIVLETDSPYLAPVPYRGKRNEPAYTEYVAEKVAEYLDIPLIKLKKITADNAEKLFELK
ncbi:TatD family hydrolase [Mangrovivirga cuniculi]|uniref:Hydrolase TatD n=1 Tax=Mangrovivirga cuniculi TaxID=2715131 RepID=A0A4D7JKS9_9BACT|nr:TatD family hydrolase [Mangrovivirga cuniculi]QCK16201.1 hydrolase TatD [Mangrovivirga cuniculi]